MSKFWWLCIPDLEPGQILTQKTVDGLTAMCDKMGHRPFTARFQAITERNLGGLGDANLAALLDIIYDVSAHLELRLLAVAVLNRRKITADEMRAQFKDGQWS